MSNAFITYSIMRNSDSLQHQNRFHTDRSLHTSALIACNSIVSSVKYRCACFQCQCQKSCAHLSRALHTQIARCSYRVNPSANSINIHHTQRLRFIMCWESHFSVKAAVVSANRVVLTPQLMSASVALLSARVSSAPASYASNMRSKGAGRGGADAASTRSKERSERHWYAFKGRGERLCL